MDREINIYLRFRSGTTCINNQNPYRLPLQALKLYSTLQIKVLSFLTILGLKKKSKKQQMYYSLLFLFSFLCALMFIHLQDTHQRKTLFDPHSNTLVVN